MVGVSTSSHIQPVSRIVYKNHNLQLNTSKDSPYCSYLNNLVTGIMMGDDKHHWVTTLKK